MRNQLLRSGIKHLTEGSFLDTLCMWVICLRADDPRANNPCQWRGKNLLGGALSAVDEAIRDSEAGSAHPASLRRFGTWTVNAGTKKSRPRHCRAANSDHLSQRSFFGGFYLFSGRAGRLKDVKLLIYRLASALTLRCQITASGSSGVR